MFSRIWTKKSTENYSEGIGKLAEAVKEADAVVIGAGSGLSTSAGLTYSGERFEKYFGDFIAKYHIRDMYSGGFYPYPDLEEYWAWWSRHIYYNRYVDALKPVYPELYEVVKDKDYLVLTTNVDHQFQKAGFDKKRCDGIFVQDKGWYAASGRYDDFIRRHKETHILFLELGVGGNTPVFRFLSTRNKLRKNTVKQQILDISHDKTREYEERRCA